MIQKQKTSELKITHSNRAKRYSNVMRALFNCAIAAPIKCKFLVFNGSKIE